MLDNLISKVYKQRYKETYLAFYNPPDFIDTWPADIRTVYCKYDNCIEISEKIIEEWYVITKITWYYELLQCQLDMEYEVEYTFWNKEYIEKLEENQMIDKENLKALRDTSRTLYT